jgi:hypothetical protein
VTDLCSSCGKADTSCPVYRASARVDFCVEYRAKGSAYIMGIDYARGESYSAALSCTMFMLIAPSGIVLKCERKLEDVVSYLVESMPTELWNTIALTAEKGKAYRAAIALSRHGYQIVRGVFVPTHSTTRRRA